MVRNWLVMVTSPGSSMVDSRMPQTIALPRNSMQPRAYPPKVAKAALVTTVPTATISECQAYR